MTKFCSKCGAENTLNGAFCYKCGAPMTDEAITQNTPVHDVSPAQVQPALQTTPSLVFQPISQPTDITPDNTAKKKGKKKPKAALVIGIVACALVVSIVAAIVVPMFTSGDFTEKTAVMQINDDIYFSAGNGYIFNITDDNDIALVKESEENRYQFIIQDRKSAVDSDTLYAQYRDDIQNLYKFTFDGNEVEREIWVDTDTLNNSDIIAEKVGYYTGSMYDWKADDDYVYFINWPTLEFFVNSRETAYQLGRISIDGENIELLGEIASTYAVKDGWIYYFDNGYIGHENYQTCDDDRVGIYKMRTNGFDKELIYDDFEKQNKSFNGYNEACVEMQIYGDYLYYIDNSEQGEGRVCRMTLDGENVEYVTENGTYSYTVDEKNKVVYYILNIEENQTLRNIVYAHDLENNRERDLFVCTNDRYSDISYYKGSLYVKPSYLKLFNSNKNEREKVAGMRYDLKAEKLEILYATVEDAREWVPDPDTGIYMLEDGEFVEDFYWEEVDTDYLER